ncbi:MAG: 2-amino-4-hydroxy-6-hydroxymethyldihydropteridine diphosphokinase [Crocinitomicaceae bacterium]
MHKVFIALGSNLGDRKDNIEKAIHKIQAEIGELIHSSSLFENQAQGFESNTLFLNACIEIETTYNSFEILEKLQSIEKLLGRIPKNGNEYESRKIDLDIIFFDQEIIQTDSLIVPHPLFRQRDFVLIPLNEIAPKSIDPETGLTIFQLTKLLKK